MADLWYPLAIAQTQVVGGYEIVLTTDRPCHLWLYWTMNPPWVHRITRLERGLSVPWDAYWCYTSWTLIEQDEDGDTTEHTFSWLGWVNCQTKYFRFHGTIGGVNSPSDSPIFWKHYLYEAPPIPPIEYLRPTGVGLVTGIWGQEPPVGEHWDKVCDVLSDDATYVNEPRRGAYTDAYLTADTAYGGPITKLVFHWRAIGPALWDYIIPRVYTEGYYSAPKIWLTPAWAEYTWELVNNPRTGLPWTVADINAMQLCLVLYAWAAPGAWCSHLYAAIHRPV